MIFFSCWILVVCVMIFSMWVDKLYVIIVFMFCVVINVGLFCGRFDIFYLLGLLGLNLMSSGLWLEVCVISIEVLLMFRLW